MEKTYDNKQVISAMERHLYPKKYIYYYCCWFQVYKQRDRTGDDYSSNNE